MVYNGIKDKYRPIFFEKYLNMFREAV